MTELEALLQERENLINEIAECRNIQTSLKTCINSLYGIMGNQYFMFYDKRCAEAVTMTGQTAIRFISHRLNLYLNRLLKTKDIDYVKLIDTDSVTLWMKPLVDAVFGEMKPTDREISDFLSTIANDKIIPYINQQYTELVDVFNVNQNTLTLKVDTISKAALYMAKKHYVYLVMEAEGVKYDPPEKKMMGIDAVKTSSPQVCRDAMSDCIDLILEGDQKSVNEFIKTFKKTFMEKIKLYDICFPRGIGKIDEYVSNTHIFSKGTPKHIKAAIIYNHLLKKEGLDGRYGSIQAGDKIRFIDLMLPNPTKQQVIGFKDGGLPLELDRKYNITKHANRNLQFEKSFLSPIRDIMDCAGMKILDARTTSIFDLDKE